MNKVWGLFDTFLAWLKGKLNDAAFQRFSDKMDGLQTVGFLVAIGSLLVGGLLASIALDSFSHLGMATGLIIAMIPFGYLAYRFEDGCRTVGDEDITPLSVGIYLDLPMVGGILMFVVLSIVGLIFLFVGFGAAGGGMLLAALFGLISAWLVANPARLGVEVDGSLGASRDILSLIMLQMRVLVRAAVPMSRAGLFLASLGVLTSGIMSFTAGEGTVTYGTVTLTVSEGGQAAQAVMTNMMLVFGTVVFPLYAYMAYVLYSFLIGFAENILSIKEIVRNTGPEESAEAAAPKAPADLAAAAPAVSSGAAFPAAETSSPSFGQSAAPAAPTAPAAPAAPAGLAVGGACNVQWSDGSQRPGTVRQVAQGQVLVGFSDGSENWVPEQYATPG